MNNLNRRHNSKNPFQGNTKKVLCVCSAGLLRSPTAAVVLSQRPYNYNTRAAGLNEYFALVIVDEVLLDWADEIVCMTKEQKIELNNMLKQFKLGNKPIKCLNIQDSYGYRDKKLIKLIKSNYEIV